MSRSTGGYAPTTSMPSCVRRRDDFRRRLPPLARQHPCLDCASRVRHRCPDARAATRARPVAREASATRAVCRNRLALRVLERGAGRGWTHVPRIAAMKRLDGLDPASGGCLRSSPAALNSTYRRWFVFGPEPERRRSWKNLWFCRRSRRVRTLTLNRPKPEQLHRRMHGVLLAALDAAAADPAVPGRPTGIAAASAPARTSA